MKKRLGHGLKTSLTVGALSSRPVQRKPAAATDIEIPLWWWDGSDKPKIPTALGE